MNQSGIEDTRADSIKTPSGQVCFTKAFVPMKERKWKSIPAYPSFQRRSFSTAISKLIMRLVRSRIKMSEKLTEQFTVLRYAQNCGECLEPMEHENFQKRIGFDTFAKVATRRGSSIAKISKIL